MTGVQTCALPISTVVVQAGKPPVVNGVREERMRVGCGSATIGMFATQWLAHADEVIVVDDHITGVLTEHQAGRFLDMKPAGIRVRGRKSTPGRYFQVANPGTGWGGTDISDPSPSSLKVTNVRTANGALPLADACAATPLTNFIAPLQLDPNNPLRLLAGGQQLWRTDDARTPFPSPPSSSSGPSSSMLTAMKALSRLPP